MTGYQGFRSKNTSDGFTLMEVLVAMTIMSFLGIAIWFGFSAAVSLIQPVPQTVKLMQEFITLDSVLREYMSRIKPPFWAPELDLYMDSTSITMPYYEGVEEQFLQIDFIGDYIQLTTNAREEEETIGTGGEEKEDSEEIRELYRSGPFTYVNFSEVSEKGLGLVGLEFTFKPEHEKIDEFKIFTRIGGHSFEKP